MDRDLLLLVTGACISLVSSIVTLLLQHFLSLRADLIKRERDRSERKILETREQLYKDVTLKRVAHISRAVEPLINALQDDHEWVRRSAAEALGRIDHVSAVEALINALKDMDEQVRQKAAEALGEIGDPRAIEPLIVALEDKDEKVRQSAAEALGKIGDSRAV
jgi:HEAT repeat protein